MARRSDLGPIVDVPPIDQLGIAELRRAFRIVVVLAVALLRAVPTAARRDRRKRGQP